ncbi:hypothetical protein C6W19_25555 [Bacillus sp. RJGP41]|nr:hypothetical protein C6W19_25555 [Bacillus sp. RJGP41]
MRDSCGNTSAGETPQAGANAEEALRGPRTACGKRVPAVEFNAQLPNSQKNCRPTRWSLPTVRNKQLKQKNMYSIS